MDDGIVIEIKKRKMKICNNVLCVLQEYIQKDSYSVESGGILIGKENMSDKNLVINNLTSPMNGDKRTYNRFYRNDKRHLDYFNNLYEESDKTIRYIGEWHTHHEAIPSFSGIDLIGWKKICRDSINSECYYHMIVGYEAIRIWVIKHKEFQARLVSTVFWRDVEVR